MLVSSGDNIKMIETRNGEGNFDILFVSKVTGELVEIKRNIYNPKDERIKKKIFFFAIFFLMKFTSQR